MERTLVIVKPDGVRRHLVGEVIRRFESRGLKILGLRLEQASETIVKKHYVEHIDKPFYGALVGYLTSGPIVVMALEGPNAIKAVRATMGVTNPAESAPGTIRGDFALSIEENIVHGSADEQSAEKELQLWFPEGLNV